MHRELVAVFFHFYTYLPPFFPLCVFCLLALTVCASLAAEEFSKKRSCSGAFLRTEMRAISASLFVSILLLLVTGLQISAMCVSSLTPLCARAGLVVLWFWVLTDRQTDGLTE